MIRVRRFLLGLRSCRLGAVLHFLTRKLCEFFSHLLGVFLFMCNGGTSVTYILLHHTRLIAEDSLVSENRLFLGLDGGYGF